MEKNKEKDTTIWKPKGNQKITRPSGPERRKGRAAKSEHRADRSQGFDAPKTGFGKLSLLIGAGAIVVALAKGLKNSSYFK